MRAKIHGIDVEGSPEDFARLILAMKLGSDSGAKPQEEGAEKAGESGDQTSEKFAYRVLQRLPLSLAQKSLLLALKTTHPGWTLSSELQSVLECSPTSLGGVLGGLGRRVTKTKGHYSEFNLWEYKWDEDEGEWAYRLPDSVMVALERAGL